MSDTTHVYKDKKHGNRGFTLIELSIIIVVISIFVVSTVAQRQTGNVMEAQSETLHTMNRIKQALRQFYAEYGHYPCPADGSLDLNDPDFGFGESSSAPSGNCDISAEIDIFTTNTGFPDDIVMGVVPIHDLGLQLEDMFDGWGNRIMYAVGEALTGTDRDCGTDILIELLTDYDDSNDLATNQGEFSIGNVPYILLSYGEDGFGAYPYNGGTRFPRDATADSAQQMINHGLADNATSSIDEEFDEADMDNLTTFFIMPETSLTLFDDIIVTDAVFFSNALCVSRETLQVEDGSVVTVSAVTIKYDDRGQTGTDGTPGVDPDVYNEGGYADYNNGGVITWSYTPPAAGNYNLYFRYTLGSGSRPLDLVVNGGSPPLVEDLDFPATGSWTTWKEVKVPAVALSAGANTIALQADAGSQGGDFDYLAIQPLN